MHQKPFMWARDTVPREKEAEYSTLKDDCYHETICTVIFLSPIPHICRHQLYISSAPCKLKIISIPMLLAAQTQISISAVLSSVLQVNVSGSFHYPLFCSMASMRCKTKSLDRKIFLSSGKVLCSLIYFFVLPGSTEFRFVHRWNSFPLPLFQQSYSCFCLTTVLTSFVTICKYMFLELINIPPLLETVRSMRTGPIVVISHYVAQCLACRRCSINLCWMIKWINKWLDDTNIKARKG